MPNLVVVMIICTFTPQEQGQRIPAREFLRDYAKACPQLQNSYSQIRGSGTRIENSGHKLSSFQFRFDGHSQKVEFSLAGPESPQKNPIRLVTCFSDENRGFGLLRRADGPRYEISWVEVDERKKRLFMQSTRKFVWAPFAIFGTPIIDFLTDASVRDLTATLMVDDHGERVVKVEYENGLLSRPEANTLKFFPDAGYALQSYQSVGKGEPPQVPLTIDVEYARPLTTTPTPILVRYTDNRKPVTLKFEEFMFGPTSAAEFDMNYYQLPDLTRSAQPRSHDLMWWLAAVAVVLMALAFVLRYWRHTRLA